MKKALFTVIIALLLTAPVYALADGFSPSPSPSPSSFSVPVAASPSPSPTTDPAFAQTPAPSSSSDEPDFNADSSSFSIDTENIYNGMTRAYKNGYQPVISGGNAVIVLPLIPNGSISGNTLTASLDLGSPTGSPFVFRSYEKNIKLESCPVNENKSSVNAFFVHFDIPLTSERFNGIYPVTVNIKAKGSDGEPIEQAFTVYITITDGKDPDKQDAVSKPTSQPILLVTGCTVTPSPAEAGSEFTAEITITNMSEKKHVYNMTVTLSADAQLELLEQAASTYYKGLKRGESITLKARYKTRLDTPAGRYHINVAMNYDNSDATTLSSSGTVSVNIKQPLKVELTLPKIAEAVNAGDTLPLSMQVMNLSRTSAYNVRVELNAPGLIPTGTGFIGNMEAGTAANADMNIFIGTKDMSEGYEGEKYGYTSGKLTLVYENADGAETREEFDIGTTINAPVISASAESEEEPEKKSQWWIAVAVGGAAAAGLIIWLVMSGKRRRKNNEDI